MMYNSRRLLAAGLLGALVLLAMTLLSGALPVAADHTPDPTTVTIAGSLQSELGCPGDWQPECATTHLTYSADDDIWQQVFTVTANTGTEHYEYKAALNDAWTESYGLHTGGDNIPLPPLTQTTPIKFYYDHKTHWVTGNLNSVIAVAPGSFQSELGCPSDWSPDCLRSWLQDPDGDGTYVFKTSALPPGDYAGKAALNESWDVNYGSGCVQGGGDISFNVPSADYEVQFSYVASTHCLTIAGAQRGNLALAEAQWISHDTVAWHVECAADNVYTLRSSMTATLALSTTGIIGGDALTLTCDTSGLGSGLLAKYPHLSGYSALKLPDKVSNDTIKAMLKGQLAIEAKNGAGTLLDATGLQIAGVLDDVYAAAASEKLGVLYSATTPTLRLWAPTAQDVKLHIFADATTGVSTTVPLSYRAASGVWSATGDASWTGKYYQYEVKVFTRSGNGIVTNFVTDPNSVSLSLNSTRSQVVNLADASLKPAGWDSMVKPPLDSPEDIVLYELHLRDFSINDPSVPAEHRGTYLAFTDSGSNGMQHLQTLAQSGLTHVHLLPVFDIASINEDKSAWQSPTFAELAALPPTSTVQATMVMSTADLDGFNWGYDPYHFNTPEGSYATDPNGSARITEFRQMVEGLDNSGLRVVMDVVYNHTNSSGQNDKSVLDKVVPGYYQRLNAQGAVETSTCCQNTASENMMMDKFIVDSTVMWAKYYKVDGFRFDLMGHHSLANMEHVRDALHALTLAHDGVDGSKIYVYGEGWNFGEVANNARFEQATQPNLAGSGIGSFNDRIRDAVRGGGPFNPKRDQGFASGLYYDPNGADQGDAAAQKARLLTYQDWIKVSMAGNLKDYTLTDRTGATVTGGQVDYNGQPAGYTLDPQEAIQYVEAHDNDTLFDAFAYKAPLTTTTSTDRARMQNVAMDVVALAQGVPFFQAGQDLLRSKSLDGNSYNSGDWFNRIDWTGNDNGFGAGLPPNAGGDAALMTEILAHTSTIKPTHDDIMLNATHFQDILAVRKSSRLFRLETGQDVKDKLTFFNNGPDQVPGLIVMALDDTKGRPVDPTYSRIVALINASDTAQTYTIGQWSGVPFALHPILASSTDAATRASSYNAASGSFTVPARTTAVFVQRDACTAQFSDVSADYWAAGYIRWAACNGIVNGYADGTFRPDGQTSRGQVAKMVVLSTGARIDTTGAPHFSDVPASDPFYSYIETAYNMGLISGHADGTFHTYELVTRAQLAKIIVKSTGVPLINPATPSFTDVPTDHWAYQFIETANARMIIGGYDLPEGGREFRPVAFATRAQLSRMLFQAWAVPGQLNAALKDGAKP